MKSSKALKPKAPQKKANPLVGVWMSADEFGSTVEYVVTVTGKAFQVEAIDRHDGEIADVFEVKWDGEVLWFAAYWNSSGRFSRCRMRALSKSQVVFTYTYTDNEVLVRKLK